MKNACAKTVKRENAYEVWATPDGSWTWYVLKKWQANDDKPYARWFCDVVTPYCPNGEMGDVYVSEIKANAVRIDQPKAVKTRSQLLFESERPKACRHPVINITVDFVTNDKGPQCMVCGDEVTL